jgi:hypothetical protein
MVRSCRSTAAAIRGTRPTTSRAMSSRFFSVTLGTSTAIGMSAPRCKRLMPAALR